jgi:predicted PurR-regulated permease PerM
VGTWVLIACVLFGLYLARGVLVLFLIALLVAHALAPAVHLLCTIRFAGGRFIPRTLATAFVLLSALSAMILVLSQLLPVLATDLTQMVGKVPQYIAVVQNLVARARLSRAGLAVPQTWWTALDASVSTQMGQLAGFFGRGAFSLVTHVLQLLGLIIVPILAFHLLRDGPRLTGWLLSLVPARRRLSAQGLANDMDRALAAYVRGQGLVCLVMGATVALALLIIGFPYPPLMGTLAGLAEAIPYVGALAIEILLFVVGLSVSSSYAILGPVVYLGINQLLALFVTPHVMGHRLSLHPMAVILAVLLGAELGGFVGMLLALPSAAVANVLLDRWRVAADMRR